MKKWFLITIIGGFAFLGLQVYEYSHMANDLGMSFANYAHGNNLFSLHFLQLLGFMDFTFLQVSCTFVLCISLL